MARRLTGPGRGVAAAAVILGLGVLVAVSAAAAQPAGRVPRVGMIVERANEPFLAAFRQGLQEVGYTDGKIDVEYRRVGDSLDRVSGLTADLVRLGVDILVVPGTVAARRAKSVTTTVPIVFVAAGDPVASGNRQEFARTGGLLSYGPSFADSYRRAAVYIDKILEGAKPEDLRSSSRRSSSW